MATPPSAPTRARGRTTGVFRQLVRQTAWRPDAASKPADAHCDAGAGWRPRLFGEGILDAAALLAAPLPEDGGTRAEQVERVEDLPLWTSLYPAATPLPVAQEDYRRLFRLEPGSDLESVAIYEAEILHHYATSERVNEVVDRLTGGDRDGAAYERVREALRGRDLSVRLRTALGLV
jgi:hypothetical protein